jgi:outer membrane beta-barrel protein
MNRKVASHLVLLSLMMAPVQAWAEEPSNLDKALERYWGEHRDPPAVQHKLHPRASRTEISAHYALIPNDQYRDYTAPGVSVTHFLFESLSLGLSASFPQQSFSKLGQFLGDTFPKSETLDEQEQYKLLAGLDVGWVPFYGKMSFLGFDLAHFDLGAYLGAGAAQTTFLETGVGQSDGMTFGGSTGVGMRFYITKWVTLRFDWRQHFLLARRPEGGVISPTVLAVGLGTLFPYTEDRP